MSECTHDCSTCSQNCGDRTEPQSFLEKPHELSNIKKVIAVVSGKGGVGKSLVTSMLSVLMKRENIMLRFWMPILQALQFPKPLDLKKKQRAMSWDFSP